MDDSTLPIAFHTVQRFSVGSAVCALDWSPESQSVRLAGVYETTIALAVAVEDRSILYYASGIDPIDVCSDVQFKHLAAINDVAVDRVSGHFIASCSDDCTLRIWRIISDGLDDDLPLVLRLRSRGVTVQWNEKLSAQVLVGEASGAIRIFDMDSQSWLVSVFQPPAPNSLLRSVDWSQHDPNVFGAVIGSKWFVWNLMRDKAIHLPERQGEAHPESAHSFRWCLADAKAFATCTSSPEAAKNRLVSAKIFMNVFDHAPQAIRLPSKSRLSSISWHSQQMVLLGSSGDEIFLWRLNC